MTTTALLHLNPIGRCRYEWALDIINAALCAVGIDLVWKVLRLKAKPSMLVVSLALAASLAIQKVTAIELYTRKVGLNMQ